MAHCGAGLRRSAVVAAAAWGFVSSAPALASDDFWAAPVNGVWQNGANWVDGATPGGGDAAFLNLAGAYTVTINANPTPIQALIVAAAANVTFRSDSLFNISTLQVTSASGSKQVLVDGATLTLGTSGGIFNPDRPLHLTLGNEQATALHALIVQNNATLNVPFGSDVVAHGLVIIGAAGQINVLGSGSSLTTPQPVNVGWVDDGTLTIQNGGSVTSSAGSLGTSAGSNGIVGVSGAGSTWTNSGTLDVGDSGAGTMNVTAGGSVTSNVGVIGNSSGSSGMVSIADANSQWINTNNLIVGYEGAGNLSIQNGGSVTSPHGSIGGNTGDSNGTVTVTGAGSTWTISGSFGVGTLGQGALTIQDGGSVSNSHTVIGEFVGSNGTATVTGVGSTLNIGFIDVAFRGSGTLFVASGGAVATGRTSIASHVGSVGGVGVSGAGSSLTSTGQIAVGGSVLFGTSGGSGTLTIGPGGIVNANTDVLIHPQGIVRLAGGTLDTPDVSFQGGGGQFQFTSGTLHVGRFNGNLLNQGGTLAPGQSSGNTLVFGDYTQQSSGTLDIEIGGLGQGTQFDFVNVTGVALVDGLLQLSLINDFVPNPSHTFVIFNAASLLGVLDNAGNGQRVTTANGNGSFLVHYGPGSPFNPNQIVLSAFQPGSAFTADFDNDGDVDGDDLDQWQGDFGANGLSDADHDGDSDGEDFLAWQRQLGSGVLATAAHSAVPEPCGAGLGALAALGLFCVRRR